MLVFLSSSHVYSVQVGIPILLSVGCIPLVLCLPLQCFGAQGIVPAPFFHLFSRFSVLAGMFRLLHSFLFLRIVFWLCVGLLQSALSCCVSCVMLVLRLDGGLLSQSASSWLLVLVQCCPVGGSCNLLVHVFLRADGLISGFPHCSLGPCRVWRLLRLWIVCACACHVLRCLLFSCLDLCFVFSRLSFHHFL